MPLAAAILIALFLFQRRGTEVVGKSFGPVMALWFVYLAVVAAYIARLSIPMCCARCRPFGHGRSYMRIR